MDKVLKKRTKSRASRVMRVRKKLKGTADKPRLSVFKSNQHIYAQLIDDESGITLAGAGTASKKTPKRKSKESARQIGLQIGELAKTKNINTVIFDRGRSKYHGVIAELANGAREAGLQF